MVGVLTIHLHLPGCRSLKEKRSIIKPLLSRLHREFNVSAAEMEKQDAWQQAVIACGMMGNDSAHLERSLQAVARWMESNWPDGDVIEEKIEII
jgi:uncharacterized protein YlxP (DUF503 family)